MVALVTNASVRSAEDDVGDSNKRRKTRKGTHSCWACKRRKEKCMFTPSVEGDSTTTCLGCQRRGTRCVSQEFPEEHASRTTPLDPVRQMREQVNRVEALVEQLSSQRQHVPTSLTPISNSDGCVASPSDRSTTESRVKTLETPRSSLNDRPNPGNASAPDSEDYALCSMTDGRLAQVLYDALPSQRDIQAIYRASSHRVDVFNESLTLSNSVLEENGHKAHQTPSRDLSPDTHPVLLAKQMLQLACILQHFPRIPNPDLSEPIQVMIERLSDRAIRLVTTQERLLSSAEGLECVMLESSYYANAGNIRLSWSALRRAMTLAQLLGFNRPAARLHPPLLDPRTMVDPQFMWFRIVMYDRYLCLILGLQQGSLDRSMASPERIQNDTPLGRLERLQCVIASRILERNDTNPYDFALTQELDKDLQGAAKSVPSKWWLPPDLIESAKDDETLFWDVRRLMVQMLHYNLLNQLHVPYMLLSSTTDSRYEYSKIACVNASREMLQRFVQLRRIHRVACSCRISDFFALMAAMTLVLAHLDSHRRPSVADSLLAHLYLSDRAMMEQAQENMEEISRVNADALTAQSATLLRRLLAIETEAAEGYTMRAESVSVQTPVNFRESEDVPDNRGARVHIPYFGVIKVRESAQGGVTSSAERSDARAIAQVANPPSDPGSGAQAGLFDPLLSGLLDPLLPGSGERADDWSFPGIDMAFFDNFLRANEVEPQSGGSEYTTDYQFMGDPLPEIR